ncbi:MAG: arylsulfatase, partial [Saprospiraceae bacterium]
HPFNSLNGKAGGQDGGLAAYEKIKTDLALYDLLKDEKELNNVAAAHPEIVKALQVKADSIRLILGDKVTGTRGTELRPLGSIYK